MASRSTPRQPLTRRSTAAFPGWKSSVHVARPRMTSILQPSSTRRPPSCTILQAVCAAASAPRPGGAPPRRCSNLVGSRVTLKRRSRLRSKQESSTVVDSNHERTPNVQTATAYLETLNPEQRRAVEHGAAGGLAAPPLLVIAGAGSGKTNTLRDEDYLILSTIHSAKGQEWKSVSLLNVVDGCMPSDLGAGTSAEIEEERRLLYVAMTRAKDDLHLVIPQRLFVHGQQAQGDRHLYAARTRFIPEKLLGLFERTAWPLVPAGTGARA